MGKEASKCFSRTHGKTLLGVLGYPLQIQGEVGATSCAEPGPGAEQGSLGSPQLELRPWVQDPSPGLGTQAHATPRVLQSRFPDAPWGCRQACHPCGPEAVGPEEQPRASGGCQLRPGCQGAEVSHPADLGSELGYKLVNLAKTFFPTKWVVLSHRCF